METLGALIDKLSVANLKLWHCQEQLFAEQENPLEASVEANLKAKNTSLLGQRARMINELDEWIAKAITSPEDMLIVNPQNKMYGRFRKDG